VSNSGNTGYRVISSIAGAFAAAAAFLTVAALAFIDVVGTNFKAGGSLGGLGAAAEPGYGSENLQHFQTGTGQSSPPWPQWSAVRLLTGDVRDS
jgi:hypothetical protein